MLENRSDKAQVAVLGGMVLAGLWAWQQLPPGAMVPVHFDLQGRADGWAPAGQGLLMLPGIAAANWGLGRLLVRIDPKRRNLERSAAAVSWVFLCITLLLAALQGLLVYSALGGAAPSPRWGIVLVGASLVGIGNVMGKLRHNYTVGVRTPWALADERIWERTQRFGGRSLVAGGLLLCALGLGPLPPQYHGPAIVAVVLGASVLPMVASWWWWRRLPPPRGRRAGARGLRQPASPCAERSRRQTRYRPPRRAHGSLAPAAGRIRRPCPLPPSLPSCATSPSSPPWPPTTWPSKAASSWLPPTTWRC